MLFLFFLHARTHTPLIKHHGKVLAPEIFVTAPEPKISLNIIVLLHEHQLLFPLFFYIYTKIMYNNF